MYCTISFNLSATHHRPSKVDEMSRWSWSFWRSDEIFFRLQKKKLKIKMATDLFQEKN